MRCLTRMFAIGALAERLDGFTQFDFSIRDEEYRKLCASVRDPGPPPLRAREQRLG